MPNWCYQKLSVSGVAEDIAAFKAAYFNEKKALELNRVIPMPPSLQIERGSSSLTGYDALYGDWQRMLAWPRFARLPDEAKTSREAFVAWLQVNEPESIQLGQQVKENLDAHGYRDWYDWSVANWGPKWEIGGDAQQALCDEACFMQLTFQTAWSPIIPALEKMTRDQPTLEFVLWYLDEGAGFAGRAFASSGVVSDGESDWRETAVDQFGWDFSEEEDAA